MGFWLFLNVVFEINVKIFFKILNELIDLIIFVRIFILLEDENIFFLIKMVLLNIKKLIK